MQLKDIMRQTVVTVSPESTIADAAKQMSQSNIGCLIITNSGSVAGIITDRDISVRCVAEGHDPTECDVEHHMSSPVYSMDPGTDILQAAHMMTERQVKRLAVVEYNQLRGLVSFSDVAQAMDGPVHDLLTGVGAVRRIA